MRRGVAIRSAFFVLLTDAFAGLMESRYFCSMKEDILSIVFEVFLCVLMQFFGYPYPKCNPHSPHYRGVFPLSMFRELAEWVARKFRKKHK